ncbi:alpha-amylase family protein [Maribacter aestuarii]|uniref:alpha-amylase family protein n=1 Tax=Maribacter aestuarii TaxID=1130723 RepID=UPI0025A5FA08|nr:alpha-amylase family protein [Maribacter aestuarii]
MNQAALHRLLTSKEGIKGTHPTEDLFNIRLATNLSLIKTLFFSLYPESLKNKIHFHNLLDSMEQLFELRPDELKTLDLKRIEQGNWYQNERLVGMQLYVDRFNKDLNGLVNKLSYLNNLGINFLHIMPITTRPSGESDGGYAVNNYHEIDPKFGTKADFLALTALARSKNILLMLDFVVNHTSDEFSWAKKAKAGDEKYQNYYYTYPDRTIPDEFEKTLPEIFPESAPGSFTHVPEMDKWVMTCFNSYQWDLNYSNPEVFIEMLGNLVKMANMGIDVVRFDALAFLWKKLGTISQNLPEAHQLISLFRLCLQVIAPGVILLAEAIVAPRNIIKYFGEGILEGNECEVAYNASLMALLWNSIATKQTSLLYKSLMEIPAKPNDATWINYIRCHDDIGLGYDDDFIRDMGWNPNAHRKFLLDYYCQGLEWSPAKGLIFMYNPKNGDGRITGSAASLLGLEKALEEKDKVAINLSIAKILMLHGIILSYGGIPVIYMGDEIGTLNDYSFRTNEEHKNDSRWVNRPVQDWKIVDKLKSKKNHSYKIYSGLKKLIQLRKGLPLLADNNNLVLHPSSNSHVFVFERTRESGGLWVVSNFDEETQFLEVAWLFSIGISFGRNPKDLITKKDLVLNEGRLKLSPYQHLWITID